VKIAGEIPAYCSRCFQHDPNLRHVDFEVSYDGPVIPGSPEPVAIDDLFLCENCLNEAFALLDPEGQKAEVERLADLLENADADIEAKDRMIQRLERTVNELVEHPIERRAGGGALAGINDPEVKRMIRNRRKARERARQAAKGEPVGGAV
jgi:hypothetical protein